MTKVQRKAYLSNLEGYPCFTPTPHKTPPGCLSILAEQTASGVPGNEVNKISAKPVHHRKTTETSDNSEAFLIRSVVLSL